MEAQTILTDVNPEERMEAIYDKLNKVGISSNPDCLECQSFTCPQQKETEQEL